ncbi:MAG: radical SAM protein [Planctomycetes bacterium]|nr:radical SAM protein [Planctomycetota bacterium]
MKASRYNRIFQAADGTWLAFNSWSTALAELDEPNLPFVRALLADPEQTPVDSDEKRAIREALIDAHFLVDDAVDELGELQADLVRDRFRTDQLCLTIAPTLDCNFRCDYCYEEHLKVHMSTRVQDALIGFIEAQAKRLEQIAVTWYGGEPLLPKAYPVVQRLSQKMVELSKERGIKYGAEIVTNGFFLDRPKMEELAALGVDRVQVTLDGPRAAHDARRHLIGGRGTYDRILENMQSCADLASFQVRVNVDRRNAMSTLEVLEDLVRIGLGGKIRVYLAQVTEEGAACGNIQEFCYSREEFARTEVELYRAAAERNLPLARYPFRIAGAFCVADRLNGWVVSPTGALFKCWHDVTMSPEKSVASLLDPQQPWQKVNEDRWLQWNPFHRSGCRDCSVAPLCHGGCPVEAMAHPTSDRGSCEPFKFHLEPLLELRHKRADVATGNVPVRDVACR